MQVDTLSFPTHWSRDLHELTKDKIIDLPSHEFHGFRDFITDWMTGCGLKLYRVERSIYQETKDIIGQSKAGGDLGQEIIVPTDLNLMDLGRIVGAVAAAIPEQFAESLSNQNILTDLRTWGTNLQDGAIYLASRLKENEYFKKTLRCGSGYGPKHFVETMFNYGEAMATGQASKDVKFEELSKLSLSPERDMEMDKFLLGEKSYAREIAKHREISLVDMESVRQRKISSVFYAIDKFGKYGKSKWPIVEQVGKCIRGAMLKPIENLEKSSLLYGLNMIAQKDGIWGVLSNLDPQTLAEFKQSVGFDEMSNRLQSAREQGDMVNLTKIELEVATKVQNLTFLTLPDIAEDGEEVAKGGDSPLAAMQEKRFNCFRACMVLTAVYADLGLKTKVFTSVNTDFVGHAAPLVITSDGQAVLFNSRGPSSVVLSEKILGKKAWDELTPWRLGQTNEHMDPVHFVVKASAKNNHFLSIGGKGGGLEVSLYDSLDGLRLGMLTNSNQEARYYANNFPTHWHNQFSERAMQIDSINPIVLANFAREHTNEENSKLFLHLADTVTLVELKQKAYDIAAAYLMHAAYYTYPNDHLYQQAAEILTLDLEFCKKQNHDLSSSGYSNLAYALERTGDFAQAEVIALEALGKFEGNKSLPALYVEILIRSDKLEEAKSFLSSGQEFYGFEHYFGTWIAAKEGKSVGQVEALLKAIPGWPATYTSTHGLQEYLTILAVQNPEGYRDNLLASFVTNNFGQYRNLIGEGPVTGLNPAFDSAMAKRGIVLPAIYVEPLRAFHSIYAHNLLNHVIAKDQSHMSLVILPALDELDEGNINMHEVRDAKRSILGLPDEDKQKVLWSMTEGRYSRLTDDPWFWEEMLDMGEKVIPTDKQSQFVRSVISSCIASDGKNPHLIELVINQDWKKNRGDAPVQFLGILTKLPTQELQLIKVEFQTSLSTIIEKNLRENVKMQVLEYYSLLHLTHFLGYKEISRQLIQKIAPMARGDELERLNRLTMQFGEKGHQSKPVMTIPQSQTPTVIHASSVPAKLRVVERLEPRPPQSESELSIGQAIRQIETHLRPGICSIRAHLTWPGNSAVTTLASTESPWTSSFDMLDDQVLANRIDSIVDFSRNFSFQDNYPERLMLEEFDQKDADTIVVNPGFYTGDEPCPILVLGLASGLKVLNPGLLGIGRQTQPFVGLGGQQVVLASPSIKYMALVRGAFNHIRPDFGRIKSSAIAKKYPDYLEVGFTNFNAYQTFMGYLQGGIPPHLVLGSLATQNNLNRSILTYDDRRPENARIFNPHLSMIIKAQGKPKVSRIST